MGPLHAVGEDVRFAHAAAERLAAALRAAAHELDTQSGARRAWAAAARAEWRGRFAERFDRNMQLCTRDADEFAAAMRDAARKLDELARLAREEQARRNVAREWHRRQQDENNLKQFVDWVTGGDKPPEGPQSGPAYGVTMGAPALRQE